MFLDASEDECFDELPAYEIVGRLSRAITYPFACREIDMNVREINLLMTAAHIGFSNEEIDSIGQILIAPGAGQAMWELRHYLDAIESLSAKGLIQTTDVAAQLVTEVVFKIDRSVNIRLTDLGIEIVESIACNVNKAIRLLDDENIRKSLSRFIAY